MSSWSSPRLLSARAPGPDESGPLLYEPYYGLREKPFSLSTDPRFLYQSASHAPVFDQVRSGITRREGLVVLTGEIGTGKTTLCRSVLGALGRKTFSAFVPDPFVTREDLIEILLVEFGVLSVDDLVRGRLQGASRPELSYRLYEFLRSLEPLDAFAVLILDEAQHLPVPLLEEIRILSDLEGGRRLLQVVLIGQPELSAALQQPRMRQMRQRVTTHCELQPLDREGVHGYVGHCLATAGARADRLLFTAEALDLVFDASRGVPRVINRLADRTLQRGQLARTGIIGADLVRAAIEDLQMTPTRTSSVPVATTTTASPVELPAAAPLPHVDGAARSSTRWWALAALILLGTLSGVTLGIYWLWAGPVLTEGLMPPDVKRPAIRVSQPLPAVLPPPLGPVGDDLRLPTTPLGASSPSSSPYQR